MGFFAGKWQHDQHQPSICGRSKQLHPGTNCSTRRKDRRNIEHQRHTSMAEGPSRLSLRLRGPRGRLQMYTVHAHRRRTEASHRCASLRSCQRRSVHQLRDFNFWSFCNFLWPGNPQHNYVWEVSINMSFHPSSSPPYLCTFNYSACKLMAKQKVALECLSYHATASQDQTVKLASEPIKSAQDYKLYSFKFIGECLLMKVGQMTFIETWNI